MTDTPAAAKARHAAKARWGDREAIEWRRLQVSRLVLEAIDAQRGDLSRVAFLEKKLGIRDDSC